MLWAQIHPTEEQQRRIEVLAADAGVSRTEVVRRLLDRGLGVADGLEERRRAVLATAGALAGDDDWPKWLGRVRASSADERLRGLAP